MKGRGGERVIVSVPMPIRLFGDLLADSGLPALMMAGDLRTVIGATPRDDEVYHVTVQGGSPELRVDVRGDLEDAGAMPSLGRAIRVLRSEGYPLSSGFDFQVASRAPGPGELSDSPMLTVAWMVALAAVHGRLHGLSGSDMVGLVCAAYEGEGAGRGETPEISASVLGGTLLVTPGSPPSALPIDRELPGMVIGAGLSMAGGRDGLAGARGRVRHAVQAMKALDAGFDVATTPLDDAVPRLGELAEEETGAIYALLVMRDTCRQARDVLDADMGLDDDRLGEMMDDCHQLLLDYLGFNSPEVARLIGAAREAGAVGCKLIPPGERFVVFAPGKEQEVVAAIRQAKGKAWAAPPTDGMRAEGI